MSAGNFMVLLGSNLTDSEAAAYKGQGFEMGVHVQNGCTNFNSLAELNQTYTNTLNQFQANYPSLPPQTTHRYNSIPWINCFSKQEQKFQNKIPYSKDNNIRRPSGRK